MTALRSIAMAFSMFSILPAPVVEWKKENMKYMLCALPLVGVVIGLALCIWQQLCQRLELGPFLFAAGMTLIPLAVSGGIHMDGFCDTVDAVSSRAPMERKLQILKDPHAGVFAVIGCGAYLLMSFGLWHDAPRSGREAAVLALVPVLSRALSALAVVTFRGARKDGLLAAFRTAADVRCVRMVSAFWILLSAGGMLVFAPLTGGAAILAAGLSFLHYRVMAYRSFGGATGDLAGYFVQVCELACLGAAVLAGKAGALL